MLVQCCVCAQVLVLLDNLHCVQSLRMSQLNLLFQRHEDALPHANMVTTCSDNCEMPVPFHQITRRLQIAELSVDEQKQLAAMQFALPADSRDVQQCVKQIHVSDEPVITCYSRTPGTKRRLETSSFSQKLKALRTT